MKILLVNVVGNTGSTGKICTDLYREFVNSGHDCCIAHGRGSMSDTVNSYKIGNPFDMCLHALSTFAFDNHGLASKRKTKKFVEFMKSYKPDVINLHNIHGYYLSYPTLFDYLKTEFSGKIIWTLHDAWSFSGHSAYLHSDDLVGMEEIPDSKKHLWEYPYTFVDRYKRNYKLKEKCFTGLSSVVITTPSVWLEKLAKKSFLRCYQTQTIYNGINLANFRRYDVEQQSKKVLLAVASIWENRKGIDDLITLAGMMPDEYVIRIVGLLPRGLKLPVSIQYTTRTNNVEELAKEYSGAFLLINPTKYDNFPTVNIESQACGTPVVTYKTGGSPEGVSEETGRVVESNTVEELYETILQYRKTDETAEKCMDFARRFSKERMALEYIKLLS